MTDKISRHANTFRYDRYYKEHLKGESSRTKGKLGCSRQTHAINFPEARREPKRSQLAQGRSQDHASRGCVNLFAHQGGMA